MSRIQLDSKTQQAVDLLHAGHSAAEVSRTIGLDDSYVCRLRRALVEGDLFGVNGEVAVEAIRKGLPVAALAEWGKVTKELRSLGFRKSRPGEQVEWVSIKAER